MKPNVLKLLMTKILKVRHQPCWNVKNYRTKGAPPWHTTRKMEILGRPKFSWAPKSSCQGIYHFLGGCRKPPRSCIFLGGWIAPPRKRAFFSVIWKSLSTRTIFFNISVKANEIIISLNVIIKLQGKYHFLGCFSLTAKEN